MIVIDLYLPDPTEKNKNALYIETEHGGHLGYYDGGFLLPRPVTWLDRTVLSLATALAHNQAKDG